MAYTLGLLEQIADGLARQFGPDCEIVIHDLKRHDLEHSVVHINNPFSVVVLGNFRRFLLVIFLFLFLHLDFSFIYSKFSMPFWGFFY